MHEVLEFLRIPLVVTILATAVGVAVGIGREPGNSRALWASTSAVCLTGVTVGALAPDATLAPSFIALGFAMTDLVRSRNRRVLTAAHDDEE